MGDWVRWMGLSLLLVSAWACAPSPPEPQPKAESPGLDAAPEIRVHPDNEQLIFRYYDAASGSLKTAQGIDAVPKEVRPSVVVMDLSQQAKVPPRALYVANLEKTEADGSHPWRVVDRYAHSRRARAETAAVSREARSRKVQLYSTEWCGVWRGGEGCG